MQAVILLYTSIGSNSANGLIELSLTKVAAEISQDESA